MPDVYLPDALIRRGSNRGFKNPRRSGSVNPRVYGLQNSRGRTTDGPKLPKPPKVGTRVGNYAPMPDWWLYSIGEWIVYWYLKYEKKFVEDVDFYHQAHAFVPYLYAGKDITQADFLLPYGYNHPIGTSSTYQALIFDPITSFTHTLDFDLERRRQLREQHYDIVYMEQDTLETAHAEVIEAGLKGKDLTDRGGY